MEDVVSIMYFQDGPTGAYGKGVTMYFNSTLVMLTKPYDFCGILGFQRLGGTQCLSTDDLGEKIR